VASQREIARVLRSYDIPSHMIAHIPNAVDVEAYRPSERDGARIELGIGRDTRVVGWHGHVQVRRKGLDILLDAWDLICSQQPDADILLFLVGSGRNTGFLRSRVDANPRVLWVDRYLLDRGKLWSYLSAVDVYTLPSRHEGFAVAPLEAMACGLPVVAADVSGISELLPSGETDGGIVVPRENHRALAAALRRLLQEPALARRLGAAAKNRAEREFSLQVVGGKLRGFLFPGVGVGNGG
jgi:starch synthase